MVYVRSAGSLHHLHNYHLPGGGNAGLGIAVLIGIVALWYWLVKSPKIPKGK
jgi:hypothetical protein